MPRRSIGQVRRVSARLRVGQNGMVTDRSSWTAHGNAPCIAHSVKSSPLWRCGTRMPVLAAELEGSIADESMTAAASRSRFERRTVNIAFNLFS